MNDNKYEAINTDFKRYNDHVSEKDDSARSYESLSDSLLMRYLAIIIELNFHQKT